MLLDTHIWLRWLAPAEMPLPGDVLSLIGSADRLAVSAVSCWEAAYLAKRGRIEIALPFRVWLEQALNGSGVECIPLNAEMAPAAAMLPDVHRDPADRFIIATALHTGMRLITLDETMASYPELKDRTL